MIKHILYIALQGALLYVTIVAVMSILFWLVTKDDNRLIWNWKKKDQIVMAKTAVYWFLLIIFCYVANIWMIS